MKERLFQKGDPALDHDRLQELIEDQALANESMDSSRIQQIRCDMERANARRLQPHFISTFFRDAFQQLGGRMTERESKRFEITRVPAAIRNRDRIIGTRESVLPAYERVTFDKNLIHVPGKPQAVFICPGHPLLDSVIDLILERHRDLLKQGAILVDEEDDGEDLRALLYLEHSIQDARTNPDGSRRVVSRQMQFVSIDSGGKVGNCGYAPYLDCRAATESEMALVEPLLDEPWLAQGLEQRAVSHAISELVPRHFQEIRSRKEKMIDKTLAAVRDRLTKEISHWDHRAQVLKSQEQAGKKPRLNSTKAQARADELDARLQKRIAELEQERKLSPLPPVVIGGALVIPAGLLRNMGGGSTTPAIVGPKDTKRVELLAMDAVAEAERRLGHQPRDVSADNCGYDIESVHGESGHLRFLEVKGRVAGADTITVTRNEVVTGINSAENYFLAIVQVEDDLASEPIYVPAPFQNEPDFGVTSQNYKLKELLERGQSPFA